MKRYETFLDKHCGQPFANIEEDVNGGLVLYEDVKAEIEKLKAENERLKDVAQAVVDAESAITYAIIAPGAERFDEIVEQRKRTLAETVHTLRQQIKEQTK